MISRATRLREALPALLILLLTGVLGIHTACSKTVTHDELWHLPVGLRNLRDGRFDVDLLNPPLARMWAAIPLALTGVTTDHESTGSLAGRRFVEDHPLTFNSDFVAGRLFNLVWWFVCGGIVCVWSWQLWGRDAALLSTLLFATCPNIMAHASIVTPDSALMCAFMATLYSCWLWSQQPTWSRGVLIGFLLGLAQATKFTGLLLYPLVMGVILWRICFSRSTRRQAWQWGGQGAVAVAVSILVLSSTYGFQGLLLPVGDFSFQSQALRTIQLLSPSKNFPVPFPRDYLLGIDQQRSIMEHPHPVFLDGQWSLIGFPQYYVMTLLWKLPHVLQLLVLAGLIRGLLHPQSPGGRRVIGFLMLSVALLMGVASREGMQLGIRYVLPILPVLVMLAGMSAGWWAGAGRRVKTTIAILMIVTCGWSLRYQPSHLAYFNELAGGPVGGRHHLLDSNLDWGQDLHLVKQQMIEQGWDQVGLAYFGTLPPQLLEIKFELPPSWEPRPGRYAVSVNYVMGRPHTLTLPDGGSRGTDIGEFAYFQNFRPLKTLGGSIDLYEITDKDVAEWKNYAPRRNP